MCIMLQECIIIFAWEFWLISKFRPGVWRIFWDYSLKCHQPTLIFCLNFLKMSPWKVLKKIQKALRLNDLMLFSNKKSISKSTAPPSYIRIFTHWVNPILRRNSAFGIRIKNSFVSDLHTRHSQSALLKSNTFVCYAIYSLYASSPFYINIIIALTWSFRKTHKIVSNWLVLPSISFNSTSKSKNFIQKRVKSHGGDENNWE